ncbi:MAG: Ig-like domain-containing protein, partial [Acutalibacteraceae bacterium]
NSVSSASYEYAMYPGDVLQMTQGAYGEYNAYSHNGQTGYYQNAFDMVGNAVYKAPFTGTIIKIGTSLNVVAIASENKVYWADGTLDYLTVYFMHDNNISDITDGARITQGTSFYHPGTAGGATGSHLHIYARRGRLTGKNMYSGSGDVYVNKALYIKNTTSVVQTGGYSWKTAPVVTDTQPPTLLNVYQDNFSNSGYTLHFTLTDNTALSYVIIYTNINGNNRKTERINLSGTRQDVSYNVKYSDYGEITGYRHGIWAYDIHGNKSMSPWIEVISDTEIPVISNIYQDNFTDDGYTIHFTITDNNSLKYFKIFSWKDGFSQKIEDINISGKVQNVSYRVKYSDFNNEKSGYINAIWAYDTANNRGVSPFIYVEMDNKAPEITNVYQDNFNDDGYRLHFTVSDTNWLKYAIVYTNVNDVNRKIERINLSGKKQEISYTVKYSDYGTKTGYKIGIWVYDVQENKGMSPWIVMENEQKETTTTETKPTVTETVATTPTVPTSAPVTTKPAENKTTLTLSRYFGSIYVTGTAIFKPTVKNGKGVTTYKSSNTRVAKVDSRGKLTALKAGTARITITNNKVSKVFTVKVLNPKLNKTSVSISRGKSYTLKITGKIGTAKFYTSNKKIATVNSKGKITVNKKAKRGSTATITVKTNGITLKCKVKVK